ncbi:mRNA-capping enzyme subunit beta [Saitoella coloradoensis]
MSYDTDRSTPPPQIPNPNRRRSTMDISSMLADSADSPAAPNMNGEGWAERTAIEEREAEVDDDVGLDERMEAVDAMADGEKVEDLVGGEESAVVLHDDANVVDYRNAPLRVAPDTTNTDIKIEEGLVVRDTVESSGRDERPTRQMNAPAHPVNAGQATAGGEQRKSSISDSTPPPAKRKRSDSSVAHTPSRQTTVHPPTTTTSSPPKRRLEPTITNQPVINPITEAVCNFFYTAIHAAPPHLQPPPGATIEIEAKLGKLIDFDTGQRVYLPVLTDVVIDEFGRNEKKWFRFEADMTQRQHRDYNEFLNKQVQESHLSRSTPRAQIEYKHLRQIDKFYPATSSSSSGKLNRTRVSVDKKTGEVLEVIVKEKIADLHVYSPTSIFDWRLTINYEHRVPPPPPHLAPTAQRDKDRMQYTHQHIQVDLTQVDRKTHELEVELSDIVKLRDLMRRVSQGQGPEGGDGVTFEGFVQVFVDNVRMLARQGREDLGSAHGQGHGAGRVEDAGW